MPTACKRVVHTRQPTVPSSLIPGISAHQGDVSADNMLERCDADRGYKHIAVFRVDRRLKSGSGSTNIFAVSNNILDLC
jgi:hypothetical protein